MKQIEFQYAALPTLRYIQHRSGGGHQRVTSMQSARSCFLFPPICIDKRLPNPTKPLLERAHITPPAEPPEARILEVRREQRLEFGMITPAPSNDPILRVELLKLLHASGCTSALEAKIAPYSPQHEAREVQPKRGIQPCKAELSRQWDSIGPRGNSQMISVAFLAVTSPILRK